MCGICGLIYNRPQADLPTLLHKMNYSLRHRGPDDEGYILYGPNGGTRIFSGVDSPLIIRQRWRGLETAPTEGSSIGLGHRRFAIIAPDAQGHQPWHDADSGVSIVFNGEILNYLELREELRSYDQYHFRSNSDTEVLLAAYLHWGTDCFEKFNGFWALAIHDPRWGRIILSRDRFGKKPLYIHRQNGCLSFSSEVRSLAQALPRGLEQLTLNSEAAFCYLLYDRRNTLYGSMWREVELFPAGHYRVISLPNLDEKTYAYWHYPKHRWTESEISFSAAVERCRELFSNSVALRLRSDVSYAACLSGGMDSSAIVAVAQKYLGHDRPLTTSYIRYPNVPELDEEEYAQAVAGWAGTNHSILEINEEKAWLYFDHLVEVFEEPVHSQAFMTQWLSWRALSEQGIKVILHGSAGDELMAGYSYLTQLAQLEQLHRGQLLEFHRGQPLHHPLTALRLAKWFGEGLFLPNISNPIRRLLGKPDRRRWLREYNPQLEQRWFQPDFLASQKPTLHNLSSTFLEANKSFGQRMLTDFEMLRIPFWVNAMDKSMMSIPVEVRMPFLDHKLVDFMLSVPASFHYRKGWTKFLLRNTLGNLLPPKVLWRRSKMGFSVPKGKWLSARRYFIYQVLSDNQLALNQFVRVEAFLNNLEQAPPDYIWRVLNFAKWLEIFKPSS